MTDPFAPPDPPGRAVPAPVPPTEPVTAPGPDPTVVVGPGTMPPPATPPLTGPAPAAAPADGFGPGTRTATGDGPAAAPAASPGGGLDLALDGPVDPISVGSAARESAAARILDRGYRRYDGVRLGRSGAIRTLIRQTVQRSLGIRRSFWSKVFPLIAVFIAYVPAIVFVGVTVLVKDIPGADRFLNDPRVVPTFAAYYGFVWAAILVFVAFVAPEVLCTDRRNGMFGLYLASPLDRDTYLLAKAAAVGFTVSLVTVGPPLLYLIGLTLNGNGPDGFGGFLSMLGRTLVAGVAVAALYVTLSFAVAATTTRRAAASAAIIMILLASSIFSQILAKAAGLSPNFLLADVLFLPFELVYRIFGTGHVDRYFAQLSTPAVVGAYLAWTLAFAAFVRARYQRIQVTR